MKQYELVVLYHPDLEIDLDKALKKVEGAIKNLGGKIIFSENWGKRKLAYQIKKQDYAVYVYYELEIDNLKVRELESQLNIAGEVIRYLLAKPTPNFGDREKKMIADEDNGSVADEVPDKKLKTKAEDGDEVKDDKLSKEKE